MQLLQQLNPARTKEALGQGADSYAKPLRFQIKAESKGLLRGGSLDPREANFGGHRLRVACRQLKEALQGV